MFSLFRKSSALSDLGPSQTVTLSHCVQVLTRPIAEVPSAFWFQVQIPSSGIRPLQILGQGISTSADILAFCNQQLEWPRPLSWPLVPDARLCFLSDSEVEGYTQDGYCASIDWKRTPLGPEKTTAYWALFQDTGVVLFTPAGDPLPTPIELGDFPHEITSTLYNFETLLPHLETGQRLGSLVLHHELWAATPVQTRPYGPPRGSTSSRESADSLPDAPEQFLCMTVRPSLADMQLLYQRALVRINSGKTYGSLADLVLESDLLKLSAHLHAPSSISP